MLNKMIITLFLLSTVIIGCNIKAGVHNVELVNYNKDSVIVVNNALKFYNWYLGCLKNDTTYSTAQIGYHWKDSTPILDTEMYLNQLETLGVVGITFIKSEKERFRKCQDSLNRIKIADVEECGCSVGEFYDECNFVDYYYWIGTQELFDGCELKSVNILGDDATCSIVFYYLNDKKELVYPNLTSVLYLSKKKNKWFIEKIELSE